MQTEASFSWDTFSQAPIIGILRGMPSEFIMPVAEAFQKSGFTTLEITMNSAGATEMIKALRENFPNLNVGAGTVRTLSDLRLALGAGAQYIVTPILDFEVIKSCVEAEIPVFPGAFTPSEIHHAWKAGASAVKVFPATQLGARYIKDVLAPLNEIKLIPTGGVTSENIRSFFDAGAVGVGMGSSLLNKDLIDQKDYLGLENYFKSILEKVKQT